MVETKPFKPQDTHRTLNIISEQIETTSSTAGSSVATPQHVNPIVVTYEIVEPSSSGPKPGELTGESDGSLVSKIDTTKGVEQKAVKSKTEPSKTCNPKTVEPKCAKEMTGTPKATQKHALRLVKGGAPQPENLLDLNDSRWYLNRELTWLEFNRRVLHEAVDERTPLLERLKFIATVSANYDADRRSAWDMQSDGSYLQRHPAEGESGEGTHQMLITQAERRLKESTKEKRKLPRH